MGFSFADDEHVTPGASFDLTGETAYTIVCWFRINSTESNEGNHFLYGERDAFNEFAQIFVSDIAAQSTDGHVRFAHRTPTASMDLVSSSTWNDDLWHKAVAVRRATNDFELFVDGLSEGTSATNPGTAASTPTRKIGANPNNTTESFSGDLARVAIFLSALGVEQADGFLYTGEIGIVPEWWAELDDVAAQGDLSGNGVSMTINGTPIQADHPPVAPMFPDDDWEPDISIAPGAAPAQDDGLLLPYRVNRPHISLHRLAG